MEFFLQRPTKTPCFLGAASAMTSIPGIPSKTVLPNSWGVPSGRHLQKAMENHRKCGKKSTNCS